MDCVLSVLGLVHNISIEPTSLAIIIIILKKNYNHGKNKFDVLDAKLAMQG